MLDATPEPLLWIAAAAAVGFLIGCLAGIGISGRAGSGARLKARDQRIRSLEAEQRVTERRLGELRREHEELLDGFTAARDEMEALRQQAASREEVIRDLRTELRHECAKTARLRQELAERAEEMVRTSVHLRDAETELGVARHGSDVILEQIARLEQERNDLNALVAALRRELAMQSPAGSPGQDQLAGS